MIILRNEIFVLCLFIAFFSWSHPVHTHNFNERPIYVPMAYELRSRAIKNLATRHSIRPIATDGSLADHVNFLGTSFDVIGARSKDELRKLLIDCVEEFCNVVNENEEIRPYLRNYPFNATNVTVTLFVHDKDHRGVLHPNICIAKSILGHVEFCTEDKDTEHTGDYKTSEEETYAEAYNIVKGCK